MVRRPRLDPEIFHLPVEKMREGYYSDKYFVRTRELLLKDDHRPCVTMQVFGKAHAFLGGIDEAIAILKLCSMEWPELEVYALYDGDEIAPWETVRSEEHTSELQSLTNLVCRLLLEKKKKIKHTIMLLKQQT